MSKSTPKPAALLARFLDALSLVETATAAIVAVEDQGKVAAIGSHVSTLQQGVTALQAVYNELDLWMR